MNKELQDLAWSVLPKEFKEEVKKEYRKWLNEPWWGSGYLRGRLRILRELFGEHNLTSDAEGEEMLTVPRKRVEKIFLGQTEVQKCTPLETMTHCEAVAKTELLYTLFGSKCLPDEQRENLSEVKRSLSENLSEHKPDEPKYKLWDLVVYDGAVHKIVGVLPCAEYYLSGHEYAVSESDLEPYTEPDTSHETPVCENHSDNTSQKEVKMNSNRNLSKNIADCDKQFDNILKDSFRNERRLNIATQIMSAILSNQRMLNNLAHGETTVEGAVRCVVDATMMYADALIAECEKGGKE